MPDLQLSKPAPLDPHAKVKATVTGLGLADVLKVHYSDGADEQVWQPGRDQPLPWLVKDQNHIWIEISEMPGRVAIVVSAAETHRIAGVLEQFTTPPERWAHPGGDAIRGTAWCVFAIEPANPREGPTLTARDEPFSSQDGSSTLGVEEIRVVIDLSASMRPAYTDGRLARALEGTQRLAGREGLTSVSVRFLSPERRNATLPVAASAQPVLDDAVDGGWATSTASELASMVGELRGDNVLVAAITDAQCVPPSHEPAGASGATVTLRTASTGEADRPGVISVHPDRQAEEIATVLTEHVMAARAKN